MVYEIGDVTAVQNWIDFAELFFVLFANVVAILAFEENLLCTADVRLEKPQYV